ncbi:MAG TPA: hypothetical protein VG755_26430 [Nannocystaceae bacterium]|nr:hypothetical protein [Nannocystaceae bacterium]
MPLGGPGGCERSSCATLTVLFRETPDGFELLPGDYCGMIPIGFEYCDWSGDAMTGPYQCDCVCE